MERISERKWQSLTKAAEKGDAEAQWWLGYYCENGAISKSGKVLSPQDRGAAIDWYLRAAEQDYAEAKGSLSNILSEGDRPDYKAAISWAKAAVAQGDASAAYNLGIIYRDLNKPKDAFRHYQLAASMGHNGAHLQIGLCHLFGHGAAHDPSAAAECFKQALKAPPIAISPRDREDAQYWLGLLTAMGLGQQRSLARARKLLEQANEDDDHEQANSALNVIGRSANSRLR